MINVAILGYGTVGSGVFEVLNENKEMYTDISYKDREYTIVMFWIFVIFRDSR